MVGVYIGTYEKDEIKRFACSTKKWPFVRFVEVEKWLTPNLLVPALARHGRTPSKVNSSDTHVTIASSPRYIFNPLAPYRMKMVQPHPRLILLLRDPTERYVVGYGQQTRGQGRFKS